MCARSNYYTWLIDTGQEGQAAALKEKEGDIQLAVQLYLKGGLAGRAAQLVQRSDGVFARDIQVWAPTTWTILEQNGPNHLGL